MKKLIWLIIIILVIGGIWLAVKDKPTITPIGTEPENLREFIVEGVNFQFDPKEIRVAEGDTVRITFKSVEGLHDWTLEGYGVGTSQINSGEEQAIEFTADKKGTFEYYCSVGDHRQKGMVGKLIVE